MADFSLNDLAAIIAARAASGGAESYTVRLLGTGRDRQLVETARFLMESDY